MFCSSLAIVSHIQVCFSLPLPAAVVVYLPSYIALLNLAPPCHSSGYIHSFAYESRSRYKPHAFHLSSFVYNSTRQPLSTVLCKVPAASGYIHSFAYESRSRYKPHAFHLSSFVYNSTRQPLSTVLCKVQCTVQCVFTMFR